jgi:succinate-semialdehyde dehydrogenase/glutarate-semialdehyde dehydrogenase
VLDEYYEPFLEKFTEAMTATKPGDPTSPDSEIGPLSSAAAADRLEDQVKRAVDQGAKIVAGGGRDGNFFEPTVLTDISPDNDAYREELFGPVAQVYRVSSEEEAVKLANDSDFGLYDYVFSADSARAMRVGKRLRAGNVGINTVQRNHETPFGGTKYSGVGRDGGSFGLHAYSELQSVVWPG